MAYFASTIDASGIHMPTYEDRLQDLVSAYRSIFGQEAALSPEVPGYQLFSVFAKALDDTSALAGAVPRQVTDLMDLVPQLASGFSFACAEGIRLDDLGNSVGIPRREDWNDETYRKVLLKKLKLFTWDGTNGTAFDLLDEGESLTDNGDGTVTAHTTLPLPANEVLPVPVGVKVISEQ